jgi:hypothetical protein
MPRGTEHCANPGRRPVQGWTLIGAIAVGTTDLGLARRAALRAQSALEDQGTCSIGAVSLRWMRLARFYRHIGALP